MPLIKKSSNSKWRVWSGPWKVGQKDNKKKVGVNVAINISADRMKDFSIVRALIQFQGTIER